MSLRSADRGREPFDAKHQSGRKLNLPGVELKVLRLSGDLKQKILGTVRTFFFNKKNAHTVLSV